MIIHPMLPLYDNITIGCYDNTPGFQETWGQSDSLTSFPLEAKRESCVAANFWMPNATI